MAKVILTCGKICSGKTTYAKKLCASEKAVLLSVDEITLALFGQDAGNEHDRNVANLKAYLLEKAAETAGYGINAVCDFGLWSVQERKQIREFFSSRGIANEIHYLRISDRARLERISERNRRIKSGEYHAYIIDEGLLEKADKLFEAPDEDEVDVIVEA